MSIYSMMNTTVSIKTQSRTKDANGYNATPALTVVASNIPARWVCLKPQEIGIYYGKYDKTQIYRVYFASNQSLAVISNWINYSGADYEIINVMNSGGFLNRLFAVDVISKSYM